MRGVFGGGRGRIGVLFVVRLDNECHTATSISYDPLCDEDSDS